MEVNRYNAPLILDEFRRLVDECEFYAVDQEMTGISCPGVREDYGMDLGEAYTYKRNAATRYTAFQFGVAFFTPTAAVEGSVGGGVAVYRVRPFNFLLLKSEKDGEVVLSTDAVQFLISNHMNFQSWLATGMNYATSSKEDAERRKLFPSDTWEDIGEDDRKWVTAMEARIVAWYASEELSQKPLELTEPHLHSNVDVALHYRLLAHKDSLWISVHPAFDSGMPSWDRKKTVITKLSSRTAAQAETAREHARRGKILSDRIGFRSFWNALTNSKKPQIGHNYSSDLMFMLNQHDAVLSPSYREFKATVHALFPCVYDTKTLALLFPSAGGVNAVSPSAFAPFKNTALEPLFKESLQRWEKEFAFEFPLGFEAYHPRMVSSGAAGGAVAHQGAYDAYMTGVVYALLRSKLPKEVHAGAENIISVFGSHLCMNLSAADAQGDAPCGRSVYHVSFSKEKMRRNDIKDLLLSSEQLEVIVASRQSQSASGSKPLATLEELDFHITVVDKAAYGAGNKNCTVAILAFFFPFHPATTEMVEDRIRSGIARLKSTPVGGSEVSEESDAPPSPLTFVVTEFRQWKTDCQTSALVSEPVSKKSRIEPDQK